MESYRSGHNGAHSKCVCLPGHEGSNPSDSAHKKPGLLRQGFFYSENRRKEIYHALSLHRFCGI